MSKMKLALIFSHECVCMVTPTGVDGARLRLLPRVLVRGFHARSVPLADPPAEPRVRVHAPPPLEPHETARPERRRKGAVGGGYLPPSSSLAVPTCILALSTCLLYFFVETMCVVPLLLFRCRSQVTFNEMRTSYRAMVKNRIKAAKATVERAKSAGIRKSAKPVKGGDVRDPKAGSTIQGGGSAVNTQPGSHITPVAASAGAEPTETPVDHLLPTNSGE